MQQKYSLIICIIAIFGVFAISGCVQQQMTPQPSTEEKITDQCIGELNVLEDKFNISREDVKILKSNCSTCSPWYTPQVATFSTTIEKNGSDYNLFFSDNCPRHGYLILNYSITSDERTETYNQMKNKICSDFNDWKIYLQECYGDEMNPPSIDNFTSCVNNLGKFIENNITSIDEDWEYCSTEGWKNCTEWNSCGPTGPTQTSICTPEYCKMSCLIVYSEERIQKRFLELCESWDKVENGKHIFSFEVPEDIEEITSINFLK